MDCKQRDEEEEEENRVQTKIKKNLRTEWKIFDLHVLAFIFVGGWGSDGVAICPRGLRKTKIGAAIVELLEPLAINVNAVATLQ